MLCGICAVVRHDIALVKSLKGAAADLASGDHVRQNAVIGEAVVRVGEVSLAFGAAKVFGALRAAPAAAEAGPSSTSQFIFRTGSQTDAALTDPAGVSFRSSVSSSADGAQVFRPGDKIWAANTGQLPPGSVLFDDVPAGHVTVNASAEAIRAATVPGGPGNPLNDLFKGIRDAFYRLPK
jgi:hypothetical protein